MQHSPLYLPSPLQPTCSSCLEIHALLGAKWRISFVGRLRQDHVMGHREVQTTGGDLHGQQHHIHLRAAQSSVGNAVEKANSTPFAVVWGGWVKKNMTNMVKALALAWFLGLIWFHKLGLKTISIPGNLTHRQHHCQHPGSWQHFISTPKELHRVQSENSIFLSNLTKARLNLTIENLFFKNPYNLYFTLYQLII